MSDKWPLPSLWAEIKTQWRFGRDPEFVDSMPLFPEPWWRRTLMRAVWVVASWTPNKSMETP